MTIKRNEEIIQKKIAQVNESLSRHDFLNHYVLDTLNSFAYRYFDEPKTSEELSDHEMRVVAIENGIKEAIKLKNPELRSGISELVKRVSKAEGPTILREIRVNISKKEARRQGHCDVRARISFGHPKHDFSPGTYVEKLSNFDFEDDLHFRNVFARYLEEVCELFQ